MNNSTPGGRTDEIVREKTPIPSETQPSEIGLHGIPSAEGETLPLRPTRNGTLTYSAKEVSKTRSAGRDSRDCEG